MRRLSIALALALATGTAVVAAEPGSAPAAIGIDVFSSSDADDTSVTRWGADLDWRRTGPDTYEGLRLEVATFKPLGRAATSDTRAYYQHAGEGEEWAWSLKAGSDGHTALGAFSVHNKAHFRQEYFLEREIVETPQGLDQRLYYTFAGGALDLPMDERNSLTVLGAVQDFTGRNVRLHGRATFTHVLNGEWGLAAQLRGRYFHSTEPGEFDYFSPRDFAEVLPTLQLRRRLAGWRYVVAAGLGAQRQTGHGWGPAGALNAHVTSPATNNGWALSGNFAYSNTPVGAGFAYDYRQFTLALRRIF